MKHLNLLLISMCVSGTLFSQEVFNPGIVKGKHVTYRVKNRHSVGVTVTNVHNPDTTIRWGDENAQDSAILLDTEMTILPDMVGWQVAKIVHDHLSAEERQMLLDSQEPIEMYLRIGQDKRKLLQVTRFLFANFYLVGLRVPSVREIIGNPESYNGFWLNFDPDRLHKIEKDIVKRVVLPKGMHKSYLEDDIWIVMGTKSIANLEKTRLKQQKTLADSLLRRLGVEQTKIERQEAIFGKEYKEDEEIEICGPPHEL